MLTKTQREEILKKAWERYLHPDNEEIADYSKYDALYDVVGENMFDDDYKILLEEMSCDYI